MDFGGNMRAFQNRYAGLHSSSSAPNSKAMAFPIVAFALILTTLVLYTTGKSNSDSVVTLLSISLFILFGSLMYAYMPAGGVATHAGVNWKGIGLAFTAALVSMLAILLIVHYTIRPIFKVRNAGPGFIPVPTVGKESTGEYWTKTPSILRSEDTVLRGGDDGTYDYSLAIDILIKDPNVASNLDRPIFSRSDVKFSGAPATTEGVTIAQQIGNYNLAMYLDKSTNDLIVSTMSVYNSKYLFENSVIENVPIQQPFRIGVVMGSRYMEVYYNGKLHSTRQLAGAPLPVAGSFVPPGNAFAAMADVRNLRLWKGTITPAEMAYLPALDIGDFGDQTQRSLSAISDAISGICGPTTGPGVSNTVLGEVQSNIGTVSNILRGGAGQQGASASVFTMGASMFTAPALTQPTTAAGASASLPAAAAPTAAAPAAAGASASLPTAAGASASLPTAAGASASLPTAAAPAAAGASASIII